MFLSTACCLPISLSIYFISLFHHRDLNPSFLCYPYGLFIAGIGMAGYTHARVRGKDPPSSLYPLPELRAVKQPFPSHRLWPYAYAVSTQDGYQTIAGIVNMPPELSVSSISHLYKPFPIGVLTYYPVHLDNEYNCREMHDIQDPLIPFGL